MSRHKSNLSEIDSRMRLNSAYQYVPTTPLTADGSKRVSLSLSDLVLDETYRSTPLKTAPGTAESSSSEYKRELAKLLEKSRGTAYEKTLKKFVETKYREIQEDEDTRAFEKSMNRSSLLSLSTSKYDSPKRSSAFDNSVLNERKGRLEEISQPMERHKYKGPEDTKRISTNHLGRQRPSPLKPKPYEFSSSSPSAFSYTSGNSSFIRSNSAQRQASNASNGEESTLTAAVSIQEFNKWLQTNREWERRTKDKVQVAKEAHVQVTMERARPMIHARSVKLAEIANQKEIERLRSRRTSRERHHGETRLQSASNGDDCEACEEEKGEPDGGADRETESEEQQQPNADSDAESVVSVYDRLAERGRAKAQERLQWEAPQTSFPHQPVILERSRQLARGRELRRSTSASRVHERRDSSNESATSEQRGSSRRRRDGSLLGQPSDVSPAPRRPFLVGSGISKVLAVASSAEPRATSGEIKRDSIGGSGSNRGSPIDRRLSSSASITGINDMAPSRQGSQRFSLLSVTSTAVRPGMRLSDLGTPLTTTMRTDSRGRGRSPTSFRRNRNDNDDDNDEGSVTSRRTTTTVDLRLLANSGIERARSLSASRRQKDLERTNRSNFIDSSVVVKPFQPTLVAKETQKIMSRVVSTFEERTLKAVENFYIKDAVAKRAVSPGPGHYVNLNVPLSPQKTVRSARDPSPAVRSVTKATGPTSVASSPKPSTSVSVSAAGALDRASLLGSPLVGSKGYSFSKEKLGRFSYSRSPSRAERGTH